MDLADKVIQANAQEVIEKLNGDGAPEGYYTDDLGFWVKQDIRQHNLKFAEYVCFRCKKLNPDLHVRDGVRLYNGTKLVRNDQQTIASLARLPERMHRHITNWVYDELFRSSPRLNRSKIEIAPGWYWDFNESEIVKGVLQ